MHRLKSLSKSALDALRSEQLVLLAVAAVVGVAAGYVAVLFRLLLVVTEAAFFGEAFDHPDLIASFPWYARLLFPAIGGLIIGQLVYRFAIEAKGSGMPDVIEAVAMKGGTLRWRTLPAKAIASSICIGSGGSAGREGPIVHMGAALGSLVGQLMKLPVKSMRTLVGCGVAGGVAGTFNTPFAGVLLAVEIVMGDFGTVKLSPIVVSAVFATVTSLHYTAEFSHIKLPHFSQTISFPAMIPYVIVGVACAFFSALIIRTMSFAYSQGRKWKISPLYMPAIGGLVVGVVGLFRPEVYGIGYETMNEVMNHGSTLALLVVILLAKLVATAATLGAGGSGGMFAPSLFMGCFMGAIVGHIAQALFPGLVSPGSMALVGMGAMLAGTTRAPITSIFLLFELTKDDRVMLPLMAACIPSVLISAALYRDSIETLPLTMRGVKLRSRGDVNILKEVKVSEVMSKRILTVEPGMRLADVVERFLETPYQFLWMTDKEGKLTGVLESKNLQIAMLERESLLELIVAQDIAAPVGATLHPDDDLSFTMRLLDETPREFIPVISRETGKLVGDLARNDVMEAYNKELANRDHVATALDAISVADRLGTVDIGDGYAIVEYEVPGHLAGKSLLQLEIRKRVGAQVLFVRRAEGRFVPGPDTVLVQGDVLLLAGTAKELDEKLKAL